MKFYGHLVGGIIAGAGICVVGYMIGEIPTGSTRLWNVSVNQGIIALFSLFAITVVMAQFPDLDTSSIPQRWFYRFIFVALALLLLLNRMDLFAILALISIAPLMHKHRGWTHSKITPWVVALLSLLILEYQHLSQSIFSQLSVDTIIDSLRINWLYIVACVAGHYTHLYLDRR